MISLHSILGKVAGFLRYISLKLESLSHKEPEPEVQVPQSWKKKSPSSATPKTKTGKLVTVPQKTTREPIIKPLHVPGLLRFKKFLAGALLCLNLLIAIMSLSLTPIFAVFFFCNSFVLLDYLYKLWKKKI